MAVEAGIGCFVVDNFYELDLLKKASRNHNIKISILLRTTPGVEAHTHRYISTGGEDSKFGFDLGRGQVKRAIRKVINDDSFDLLGLHCHIGSQIFDENAFTAAANKIFEHLENWLDEFSYYPKVLNLGGGFGIRYVEGDAPKSASQYVAAMAGAVSQEASRLEMDLPEIWIEPGRSLVGNAGTTLYTIGSKKEIAGIRDFAAVDGGMNDNLRPALYNAEYEGMLANRGFDKHERTFSIAGKCCESGDMLMWDLPLPDVNHGDLLAVFSTGAYGFSMANNYNRLPRPAVVFVENGDAQLVVRRESYEDLVQFDLPLRNKAMV